MLRLKNSNGDSVVVDLLDDLEIMPETSEKLGEITIEADELIRLMLAQALDNLP